MGEVVFLLLCVYPLPTYTNHCSFLFARWQKTQNPSVIIVVVVVVVCYPCMTLSQNSQNASGGSFVLMVSSLITCSFLPSNGSHLSVRFNPFDG